MSMYLNMKWVGNDYYDVDVEYDVIDGDESVGLPVDYEYTVTYTNELGLPVDFTEDLTPEEIAEVIEAIEKDLERDDYDYVD
jgi:hypothetical protein